MSILSSVYSMTLYRRIFIDRLQLVHSYSSLRVWDSESPNPHTPHVVTQRRYSSTQIPKLSRHRFIYLWYIYLNNSKVGGEWGPLKFERVPTRCGSNWYVSIESYWLTVTFVQRVGLRNNNIIWHDDWSRVVSNSCSVLWMKQKYILCSSASSNPEMVGQGHVGKWRKYFQVIMILIQGFYGSIVIFVALGNAIARFQW